uniref:Uncharacterized protein n=1 Tax=Kalanchoe fedtschenkoi TaxID=63787 RepID=A0A7N0RDC0_KALFE
MASKEAAATRVQIEAIQTVVSMRPADPPLARKITLGSNQPAGGDVGAVFRQCHQILLCYGKASEEEDSGRVMIGRLKESLGVALCEYPMLTGRIKWENRELVLVATDSGMRLVEAKFPIKMDEFVGMEGRAAAEGELVYWEDLKPEDPQFSPLAYIQVTEFECGGYSIGLSLSVLLGDSLELTGFLKRLAATHLDIFFKQSKPPAIYLPKHKSAKLYPVPSNLSRRRPGCQTLLYRIDAGSLDATMLKGLASLCAKDAEQKLDADLGLDFTLYAKDGSTGDLVVEKGLRKGLAWPTANALPELNGAKWDDTVLDEVTFWEGRNPIRGAYWIRSDSTEGLIMVNTSRLADKTVYITVSIP